MIPQHWITRTTLVLTFNPKAHGFKLSSMHYNRLYFYPNEDYDMDMTEIPKQRFTIAEVVRDKKCVQVFLKLIN